MLMRPIFSKRKVLDIRERVQEFASEYKAVDTRIKAWAKEQPWERAIVGPCLLKKKSQKNGTRVEISPSLTADASS